MPRRLREWSTKVARIKAEDLAILEPDRHLADEMRTLAEEYARTLGDDFSLASIDEVSGRVRSTAGRDLSATAAYVGEVIIRHSSGYWGRGGRHRSRSGVVIGCWLAEPTLWLNQMRSDSRYPDNHLVENVSVALRVASDPEAALDDAEYRLDAVTAWHDLRMQVADWRRRARDRRRS